jgi:hypothetical protein
MNEDHDDDEGPSEFRGRGTAFSAEQLTSYTDITAQGSLGQWGIP